VDSVSVPTAFADILFRLALATVLGAAIGVNRELVLKPAGMRTHALVALGTALLTMVGLLLTTGEAADVTATSRIVQGLVAGIGFIGGGVILHLRDERTIQGLTTAASIWIVAALGVAGGAGLWRASLAAAALALAVLTGGRAVERALHRSRLAGRDDD
jgi:putative Mg2+ transporter-C (MgtC) family protein